VVAAGCRLCSPHAVPTSTTLGQCWRVRRPTLRRPSERTRRDGVPDRRGRCAAVPAGAAGWPQPRDAGAEGAVAGRKGRHPRPFRADGWSDRRPQTDGLSSCCMSGASSPSQRAGPPWNRSRTRAELIRKQKTMRSYPLKGVLYLADTWGFNVRHGVRGDEHVCARRRRVQVRACLPMRSPGSVRPARAARSTAPALHPVMTARSNTVHARMGG
jgi:hypothetical protein